MKSLNTRYALNGEGQLIFADNATKDESYFCPNCTSKLIFRAGEKNKWHFAHHETSNCNNESLIHAVAKILIINVINDNSKIFESRLIKLKYSCLDCNGLYEKFNKLTVLKSGLFSSAENEFQIDNYRVDVVAFKKGSNKPNLAIEILNTHKIEQSKGLSLPIHWIELKAEDVIEDPYFWKPVNHRLKDSICPECSFKRLSKEEQIKVIADSYGIPENLYTVGKDPSAGEYVANYMACFKCKKRIPVFWWPGIPFCEEEPPKPMPKTIKCRYSKMFGGKYWVNTCANCGVIQGDNFVFLFEDAPLNDMIDPKKTKF
ncbi:MAG: competence protein CoiA family protein [Candidatus Muiribacteriota bacterium]